MDLAEFALRLRDEQLKARVVYVDPTLKTNAELDAITAQVVAELGEADPQPADATGALDPQQVEIELIKALREHLEKMLSPRREQFLRYKIELIQRRITNLFFASEIHGTDQALPTRAMYHYPDDALYHVLRHHEADIVEDLETLPYKDPRIKAEAIDRFKSFQKQLVSQVLARSMPDLEKMLVIYRDVLFSFLVREFASQLGEFAWEVVKESRVAHSNDLTYKIREQSFDSFRHVFERKFLDHLLVLAPKVTGALTLARHLRPETLRFLIFFASVSGRLGFCCNAIYEFLHGEGFLDLPTDWKRLLKDQ